MGYLKKILNSRNLYNFLHCDRVQIDIISSLKMKDPYITIGSFDRGNLFYGVKHLNRGQLFINELVREVSKFVASTGSTIIYCTTIKDVEQVSFLPASCYNSVVLKIKKGVSQDSLDSLQF